jgi:hypothetical protein
MDGANAPRPPPCASGLPRRFRRRSPRVPWGQSAPASLRSSPSRRASLAGGPAPRPDNRRPLTGPSLDLRRFVFDSRPSRASGAIRPEAWYAPNSAARLATENRVCIPGRRASSMQHGNAAIKPPQPAMCPLRAIAP